MVPFNVKQDEGARFHLGTSGPLAIERAGSFVKGPGVDARIATALRRAGFDVVLRGDLKRVQYAKLLINLNNSVNALAGVPLREELSNRDYRRVFALSMREGLACMKAAGIRPERVGKMIPRIAPFILELPDALFFRVAGSMVKIDASARSSMGDDLARGRATEIDYLNGEILRLAERTRVPAPVNGVIAALVKEAEIAKRGSPRIDGATLLAKVTRAA
jgi:2-dehydropantoate 2-reductase